MTHQHDGWANRIRKPIAPHCVTAIRAATADIEPTRIVAMGLGSQVDGVVACDADGKALRPAIIWLDKRATEQCDRLVAAAGRTRWPRERVWWPTLRTARRR
jgi:xylulokinase